MSSGPKHTDGCDNFRFQFHAATGGDAQCICRLGKQTGVNELCGCPEFLNTVVHSQECWAR